jgi:hypothetical protein
VRVRRVEIEEEGPLGISAVEPLPRAGAQLVRPDVVGRPGEILLQVQVGVESLPHPELRRDVAVREDAGRLVAGGAELLGEGVDLGREGVLGSLHAVLAGHQPGEDRGDRRTGPRRGGLRVEEQRRAGGERVDPRRRRALVAVDAEMIRPQAVDQIDDDVRARRGLDRHWSHWLWAHAGGGGRGSGVSGHDGELHLGRLPPPSRGRSPPSRPGGCAARRVPRARGEPAARGPARAPRPRAAPRGLPRPECARARRRRPRPTRDRGTPGARPRRRSRSGCPEESAAGSALPAPRSRAAARVGPPRCAARARRPRAGGRRWREGGPGRAGRRGRTGCRSAASRQAAAPPGPPSEAPGSQAGAPGPRAACRRWRSPGPGAGPRASAAGPLSPRGSGGPGRRRRSGATSGARRPTRSRPRRSTIPPAGSARRTPSRSR